MKKFWILPVLIMFACGSEVEKLQLEDINSLEEGIAELNKMEDELDTIMNASVEIELTHFSFLQDSLVSNYVFASLKEPMKLDRYELVSQEKIQWSSNAKSMSEGAHELYQATIHEYADSLKCKTALYNWLDCYGKSCTEIKVGKDTLVSKGNVVYVWVTEKEILTLKSSCGNDAQMDKMKMLFTTPINPKDIRYQYMVDCKGRLKWITF